MPLARASADRASKSRIPLAAALLAAATSLLLGAVCWGFTVDDALITCRYAHHLATGRGYVMSAGGPSTDGVTPLGFAHLLSLFAAGGSERALFAAKLLGLTVHTGGAALLAFSIAKIEAPVHKWAGLAIYFAALPVSAWSVSGLETGFVEGLVALGASLRVLGKLDRLGIALLAIAAGLRPELLPMVVILSVPRGQHDSDPSFGLAAFGRLAMASAPFVLVAVTRALLFGRPAPLSVLAKRPDLTLGFRYALACLLLTGFVALLAPIAWRRGARFTRWLSLALVGHTLAIAFAGGDWMPISRLFVPAMPILALAVAGLAATSHVAWAGGRLVLALAGEIFVWVNLSSKIMHVSRDREALIAELRAPLEGRRVIAALDIGFVGVAAPDASVVDLAGVTDPEIAILPGSHTEKQIPDGLLQSRGVDTLVFGLKEGAALADPWTHSSFARGVERWVALAPDLDQQFEPVFVSSGRLKYVVIVRHSK